MGDDAYWGDLELGLACSCDGGIEACLDGVGEVGEHRVSRGVLERDDEVRVLDGVVFLGVRDNVGSIRRYSESEGGLQMGHGQLPN